jgi:Na+/H+ antiporter NhaD/arsenite permease-like protein
MFIALTVLFIVAYAAIALEHPLGINKSATALICAGVLWVLLALGTQQPSDVNAQLAQSLISTAQIVFFLLGAMTIVEVIDAHDGFDVITRYIKTDSLPKLMGLTGLTTFFLSAFLDNLTTTIVMISLMRRLLGRHDDRLLFAGMIVIAANAGGAWSPIGDVTTTMLWIGGQITAIEIIKGVFWPSLVNMTVPLAVVAYVLRGHSVISPASAEEALAHSPRSTHGERLLMLGLGLGTLAFVPVFKALTHLPPFMGILFGLGLLWLVGDIVHRHKDDYERQPFTTVHALSRIDMSSIVFFTGILLAVAALEQAHILSALAHALQNAVGREDLIVILIGFISAIADNVPLVAAAMGMYSLAQFPTDHFFWEFLAYCAGTGGSLLVIGSAAGVAAMGMEKINFIWYLKKISGLALIGYLAGALVYLLQHHLFG